MPCRSRKRNETRRHERRLMQNLKPCPSRLHHQQRTIVSQPGDIAAHSNVVAEQISSSDSTNSDYPFYYPFWSKLPPYFAIIRIRMQCFAIVKYAVIIAFTGVLAVSVSLATLVSQYRGREFESPSLGQLQGSARHSHCRQSVVAGGCENCLLRSRRWQDDVAPRHEAVAAAPRSVKAPRHERCHASGPPGAGPCIGRPTSTVRWHASSGSTLWDSHHLLSPIDRRTHRGFPFFSFRGELRWKWM